MFFRERLLSVGGVVSAIGISLATCGADLADLVQQELNEPIRPGGVDGSPFWNSASGAKRFIFPPAFDFAISPRATKYRLVATDMEHGRVSMEATVPTASLAPIWDRLSVGFVVVWSIALDASGHPLDEQPPTERRRRVFWKAAPFEPGAYPPAPRSYAESARMAFDYIFGRYDTQSFLKTGKPHPKFRLNCYPSKIHGARILLALAYGKLHPDRRAEALKVAKAAADYLLAAAQPAGSPLEYLTPTYEGTDFEAGKFAGQNMIFYAAQVGSQLLRLHETCGEARYRDAAERIGRTFLRLQSDDGSWPLSLWEKDGREVDSRCRSQPIEIMELLDELYVITGDGAFRQASDRALTWLERTSMSSWNWEGQFEDTGRFFGYENLSATAACLAAKYLLRRFPNDPRRVVVARDALRFAEDQFVCWRRPCTESGLSMYALERDPETLEGTCWSWPTPCVLEQYSYHMPVDMSSAMMITGLLALYRVTGDVLALAKARTLGDTLVRIQRPDGFILTNWFGPHLDPEVPGWPNCSYGSASALLELAAIEKPNL